LRGQAAQARLAPELQRLRQRYAKQPDRLQRELTALYQREGTSMFAGFAPLLAQWPVFSVLYLLFRSPTVGGAPNRLLSRDLLGVPLGSHWLSGAGLLSVHGAVFLGVLALLAAACWLAARSARRVLPQTGPASLAPGGAASSPQALTAVTKVLPYLTVVIAMFAPLAGAIYLVTSTGWSAAERLVFAARTGGPAETQAETDAARAGRPAGKRPEIAAGGAGRAAGSRPETGAARAGQSAGNRPETHAGGAGRAAGNQPETNAASTGRAASSRPGPAERRKTSRKPTRPASAGQRKPGAN
jgi:YidC/Oxa1 family membrane protein insertase